MSSPKRQKTQESKETTDWFQGRHIISVKDFDPAKLARLFSVCTKMKNIVNGEGSCDILKGKILCTLFYEPSTRTHMSFQAAMYKLGGQVLAMSDVKNSSVAKGETLADTVRSLECYSDVMVMRHPQIGSAKKAASFLKIPLINGGDGAGEHPSQALLDAYTIYDEFGKIDGLTITIVGDLKYGRTVHSLVQILKHYKVKLNFVSPDFLKMPEDIQNDLKNAKLQQTNTTDLSSVIKETDVLYVTRVQKERFEDENEYKKAAGSYVVSVDFLEKNNAKKDMIIMHPLPRVDEISTDVDDDPRAAYFREMRNGMITRMALLALVLGRADA